MQLESKEFYKLVVDNRLNFDLVKSIGDCVFKELADLQRDPPNLILDIRGIGYRYLRLKKTKEKMVGTETALRISLEKPRSSVESMETMEHNLRIYRRIASWYEEFLREKARIKNLRHEFSARTQIDIPTLQVPETGPDQPGEHQGFPSGESKSTRVEDIVSPASTSYRGASLVEDPTDQGAVSRMSGSGSM